MLSRATIIGFSLSNTDENYLENFFILLRLLSPLRGLEIIISQCSVDEMPSCSPSERKKFDFASARLFYDGKRRAKKASERAIILRKIQTPIFLGYDPWNSLT